MNSAEYLEKLQRVINREDDTAHLSHLAPIVAMFLEDVRPGDPAKESGDNMTSQDIVYALEETCQLTVNEVAAVMMFLGFRLHINEYHCHEWAIVHKSVADPFIPPPE